MGKSIVNLNKILEDEMSEHMLSHISQIPHLKEWIFYAMKEACIQTLKLAAENADLIGNTGSSDTDIYVKSVYVNC
jgi:hypothetical protein